MEDVTLEEFLAYEEVRRNGVINVMDARTGSSLAGIPKDRYINVMRNYAKCRAKWPDVGVIE
jgi:hypothetical protein